MKRPSYSLRRLLVLQVLAACALGAWQWQRFNSPEQKRARFVATWERKLAELPRELGAWHVERFKIEADAGDSLLHDAAVLNAAYELAGDDPVSVLVAVGPPRDLGRFGAPGCYYWTVLSEEEVDLANAKPHPAVGARLSRVTATPEQLYVAPESERERLRGVSIWLVTQSISDGWDASAIRRGASESDQVACVVIVSASEPADLEPAVAQAETKQRVTSLAALLLPEIQKLVYGEP